MQARLWSAEVGDFIRGGVKHGWRGIHECTNNFSAGKNVDRILFDILTQGHLTDPSIAIDTRAADPADGNAACDTRSLQMHRSQWLERRGVWRRGKRQGSLIAVITSRHDD